MGILGYIVVGLICGAIAKALLKDRAVGGWLATLLLGIVGAIVGGWLGGLLLDIELGGFFELRTWLLAILGSVVVLFVYTAITGKRSRR
ncbi:Transglycosylase associated protein [Sanguibacter keddieii DSM 10542]|uniref:Transglycosylase associated protein n=1 Tax=Sanguibacter keddieii (strain ATCC 51767 / DSM 10542 / NCFB 3025 / ST-74) TaxID=446469 RepID=D1BGD6_SANKS|nr:GlsB/YeaQ/YmgE family stress response membrane protein [Sanguibacter keddieii]ACZ23653.1 Transglycosylase associated protein [Sanguibacter keddieii DSM 10542]